MGKWEESMWGTVRLRLQGSFPEGFLNACAGEELELWDMDARDACTLELSTWESRLPRLQQLAEHCGCHVQLLQQRGGSRGRAFLRRRRWLLGGLLLALGLMLLSSLFLWEIDIQGECSLSEARLRRVLAECGVEEGRFWPSIQPDLVRSRMLRELPELSWMTVNLSGSRAVVLVSPRLEKPPIYGEEEPGDVVAGRDGIIRSLSVLEGSCLVQPGQTVQEGQLLVSGSRGSPDGKQRLVSARAEVVADTVHEIAMVFPSRWQEKGELRFRYSRFAVQFGKKRINLYGNSGNGQGECDKITKEYKLGAEGLFALPLRLIREDILVYQQQEAEFFPEEQLREQELERLARQLEGEILSHRLETGVSGGLRTLTLYVHCRENIACSRAMTVGKDRV